MSLENFFKPILVKASIILIKVNQFRSIDGFLSPIFSPCLSKVWSMLHHGLRGQVQSKEFGLCLQITFWRSFVVIHQKICVFIIFITF